MTPAVLPLLTSRDREAARRLIESQGLSFEEGCDDIVGMYEAGRLVATAARAGYVLKMFAIDPEWQGGDALGQLTTALVELGRRAGHEAFFVYTRPASAASFEACGFRLLVATGEVALLEHGGGLEAYLARASAEARPTPDNRDAGVARGSGGLPGSGVARGFVLANGSVVVNGNPFTLGHLYLVETAAPRVARLLLFVVREDRSVFPFDVRFRLAREATAHLANVVLLDTSRYAISAGTFPSYFLRRHDEAARLQMEVDARLFGAHIAPAFSIDRRFVGEEPYCETTATYNGVMAGVLPEYGVRLEVVPRLRDEVGFVSATRVRAALAAGDFDAAARMVPPPTLDFLRSAEGGELIERLRQREAQSRPPRSEGRGPSSESRWPPAASR